MRIRNIGREIRGARIGHGAVIENTAAVTFDPGCDPGYGVSASVLDETGSRPVLLYPGLSAQAAMLMAIMPRWAEEKAAPRIGELRETAPLGPVIAEGAVIIDCCTLHNV